MYTNNNGINGGEYQPTRLELFKQNHDIAFNFLKKGIELDEAKQFEKARDYYKEGIQCILQAERVPLSQQERYQAKSMLEKLQRHKSMFYDRMKEIDQELFDQKKQKQAQLNNISESNNGGIISGFMKLFTASPATNTERNVVSQDTRSLCGVNNSNRHEPIYNQYTTNSQVLKSFPATSSTNSTSALISSNMYNSVNICEGISQKQQVPTVTRKRSSSNDKLLFGHYDALASLPQNNLPQSSMYNSNVSQQPQQPYNIQQQQQQPQSQQHTLASIRSNSANNLNSNNNSNSNPVTAKKKPFSLDQIPELKGMDRKLLDHILNEVIESKTTNWDDIAGLKDAKQTLLETVILPSIRPDLFNGLRAPCRGILLFGPPGTGKTMIARACASQCNATFFSISAGSLVSKYHGDGEKLVRCLFGAARYLQPSVIFIDEIDSILSARSSEEHEASRRMKTEFMIQMDGVSNMNGKEDRVLVMGATNIPQELDEAILRRFSKRIYIPLPDHTARCALIKQLSIGQNIHLSEKDVSKVCDATEGFSGSDLTGLCKETSMMPLREISLDQIISIDAKKIRPIVLTDFMSSLSHIRPSTSKDTIHRLEQWNSQYGTFAKKY